MWPPVNCEACRLVVNPQLTCYQNRATIVTYGGTPISRVR